VRIEVPFGGGTLGIDVPAGLEVEFPTEPYLSEEDPAAAARKALSFPSGSAPLESKARGAADAVIVVPDATRGSPTAAVLPLILDALEKAKVPARAVTVLVARGLHRALTPAEREAALGPSASRGVGLAEHDARGAIRDLGTAPGGAPLRMSEMVAAAKFVMSIGIVEPHQYAGYSGGWKTVGIGCAGEETIAWTHAPRFLDSPRCRPGLVDGNPFLEVVKENARRAGLKFALNLVLGPRGGVVAAGAGDPGVVHRLLALRAKDAFALPVKNAADVALAGIGAPKDANLYQATRAASNLLYGPLEAVKPGGTIILPAPCPEGVGRGMGEQRFAEALRRGPAALLADKGRTFLAGEQRAYMTAKVLATRKIVVVGSSIPPADLQAMGLGSAARVEDALKEALSRGAKRLLVVQRALRAMPVAAR